jgi:hypothetical protein
MKRVMGAVAAVAAATIALAAAMAPALAATRPSDRFTLVRAVAQHAPNDRVTTTARDAKLKRALPDVIASQFGGGKYVTVVRCSGSTSTPPPVRLARLDDPLTVRGAHPSAAVIKLLAKPKSYKTIYTCTVVVEVRVPAAKKKTTSKKSCELGAAGGGGGGTGRNHSCHHVIILDTGFGGEAGPVSGHHPAG